jgi:phosphoribosyl-dephospho-CoA transferase
MLSLPLQEEGSPLRRAVDLHMLGEHLDVISRKVLRPPRRVE